jgi:hypothetical protein
MRRLISLGVVVAALCALLCVTAGGALAVDLGRKCAKVTTAKTGRYEDSACSKVSAAMEGEFLVEEAIKKNFTISSGESVLAFSGGKLRVKCEKDKGTGKILNDIESESTLAFEGCTIETNGKKCGIANITTNVLLGQAGKIAATEAASEMGVYFTPKTGSVFARIPESPECLEPELAVEGSIVCERAAQVSSATGKVLCLVVGGAQKAKKVGVLEAGAKGKEATKEGRLEVGGLAATLKTEETVTFEEALTLFS